MVALVAAFGHGKNFEITGGAWIVPFEQAPSQPLDETLDLGVGYGGPPWFTGKA